MYADLVCDECNSSKIDPEGYCMNCGLYLPKDKFEESYWNWLTADLGSLTGDASHGYKVGLPWVTCKSITLDKMMEYPEAIRFLEQNMVTSLHPINMGDYIVPPARAWRVDSWKSACQKLLGLKCSVPSCYKMAHKRESGRTTKTWLCKRHLPMYLKISKKASFDLYKAKHNGD